MKTITPIYANSDNKDETYRLLNIVHVMAGQMAVAKMGGWELKCTATYPDYALTTWTNGIVDVTAETSNGDYYEYKMVGAENE